MRYGIKLIIGLWLGVVACGCKLVEVVDKKSTLQEYISLCQEVARDKSNSIPWERKATYEVVYEDEQYLSFRAMEYEYNGGAHGFTAITVGTIERATGRVLKAADFIPESKRAEALSMLRESIIQQIGGEAELQAEVRLIDNCYLDKDGIHFVYNEYEVACYAAGAIEVVYQR